VIEKNSGLRVTGVNLWLDATRKKDLAFISHAHTDHIHSHRAIIASERTCVFLRHRNIKGRLIPLPFQHPLEVDGGRVTLHPSGHILGASQIMIETRKGSRVVYTGDLRLATGVSAEPAEILKCDILVIEATYGDPRYVFPGRHEVIAAMISFMQQSRVMGRVPVFFAYPLGKAQEAMAILAAHGYVPCVHPRIAAIAGLYEELGVPVGPYEIWNGGSTPEPKHVIILPTGARTEAASISNKRTAALTGWAVDNRMRYRYGADEVIPLSDHADFSELLAYVTMSGAKRVYTVHGSEKLAAVLRTRGIEACHLDGRRHMQGE